MRLMKTLCAAALLVALSWTPRAVAGEGPDEPPADIPALNRGEPELDPAGSVVQQDGPVLDLEGSDPVDAPLTSTTDQAPAADRTSLTDDLATRVGRIVDRTVIGGYGEVEYHNATGQDSYFLAHRYVLFVYSQISERISTATEIEFEFAGSPAKKDGALGPGEVLLEFSVVDFRIADWMILRGGIVLVPFGAFNIRHDAPTRDLTERPRPLTTITPTTWFEAGFGLLGDIDLGAGVALDYEVYVINGLDAKIDREHGMKGATGSKMEDNNDDKAVVGRIGFSPMLGIDMGVSGYTGVYDDSDNRVNMLGADLTLRFAWFEFLGEYVRAFIDEGYVEGFAAGSVTNTREAVPRAMQGFYVQANFHFPIPGLFDLFPPDMADATMTGVIRYEDTDTDLDFVDHNDVQKLTFGLNFRPIEAYVIKTEVQLVSNGAGGVSRNLFSGAWDPEPAFVGSMAWLF